MEPKQTECKERKIITDDNFTSAMNLVCWEFECGKGSNCKIGIKILEDYWVGKKEIKVLLS